MMVWQTVVRVILLLVLLPALAVGEETEGEEEQLKERLGLLEQMIKKIEQVEIIKKAIEYVCPGGKTYEALPEGGLCPGGILPQGRVTFKKVPVYRSESMQGKIEEAITEAENKRVAVFGSARGILQYGTGGNSESSLFPEGSFDLLFLSRPSTNSTFFIDLEAISGEGPDQVVDSLTRLNADAERVAATSTAQVREAWLSVDLLRFTTVVGKINMGYYFDRSRVANDETTQFLNTSLVNNPMLRQPPNGAGVVIQYYATEAVELLFGIQNPDPSVSNADKLYASAEIDYRHPFSYEGHWRVWRRMKPALGSKKESAGMGFSLDQDVTGRLTLFARAGFEETEGVSEKAEAFSAGGAYTPQSNWLVNDRIGIAFSQQKEIDRLEKIAEGYYNRFFTDRLSASLDLQWLIEGTTKKGKENKEILVPGVRVTIYF